MIPRKTPSDTTSSYIDLADGLPVNGEPAPGSAGSYVLVAGEAG